MNAQYNNFVEAAKATFVKNYTFCKQDDEEAMMITLVKAYNTYKESDNPYELIYVIDDKRQFIKELERAEDATFEQLMKARLMGARYVWQNDGLEEVDFNRLASVIAEDEFENIFDDAMITPQYYADFLALCLSPYMFDKLEAEGNPSKAANEITINGRTFNKCYFDDKKWNEIENPCAYCHDEVQSACGKNGEQFCRCEHCCFIDLGLTLGEQEQ